MIFNPDTAPGQAAVLTVVYQALDEEG